LSLANWIDMTDALRTLRTINKTVRSRRSGGDALRVGTVRMFSIRGRAQ
jgi:hypothetical protein